MATRRIKPQNGPGRGRGPGDESGEELDEGPSEADLEQFGGVTRPCPECGTDLYDDAEICWKCGHALSGESKGIPAWVVVTAIVALAAMAFFIIR